MSIVVNTPNGNIGRPTVSLLLAAGESVTIISRSPDKVADLVERGAKLVQGSIDDTAVLDQALAGAKALFWLTPPPARPDFLDWGASAARTAAEAAKRHGVERVVVLSSAGAHSGPGTGPVSVLLSVEDAFRAQLANVAVLRPGFFMENFLRDLYSMAKDGAIYSAAPAGKKTPYVATRDIAAVAATKLSDASWTGHAIHGVHGPADVTPAEAAAIISEALGSEITYVEITVDQARAGMRSFGIPDFLVDTFTEMYQGIRDGKMDAAEPRTAETTTETTLAQFANEAIAPAVAAARASLVD